MTTLGNYYVCMSLRRLDKLHMHRSDGFYVLLNHRLNGATTFGNITPKPPDKSNVVGCVDKNLDIHLFEQTRFSKDQDSLDYNDRLRLDRARFVQTSVGLEIVKW